MKSSVQMNVAKHMLAIWMKPKSKSLKDTFSTIDRCWPMLSRRVLRSWVKALHKNPERYEYTSLSFKKLKLEEHFTPDELNDITSTVDLIAPTDSHHRDIYRIIIMNKWVYGQSSAIALEAGLKEYYGASYKTEYEGKFIKRAPKPVLKS